MHIVELKPLKYLLFIILIIVLTFLEPTCPWKKAFQCRHLTKWNFTTTHTYEHITEPCLLFAHNVLVENNMHWFKVIFC